MSEPTTTVYVTKYALTDGIKEMPGTIRADGYANVRYPGSPSYGTLLSKSEYAETRDAAIKQARDKRDRKLASLRKQINKLSDLGFE